MAVRYELEGYKVKKIISLFQRNYEGDRLVRDCVTPGAEWVVNGEGIATRKWDGTAVLFEHGRMFKRYDAKHGKTPPPDFVPAQEPDAATGHWPGWVPCVESRPDDRWHYEGLMNWRGPVPLDPPVGTYELVGPKIGRNPEGLTCHFLYRHGDVEYPDCPRDFAGLKAWLWAGDIEGIVWHHPDGRMVKIKTKDFGFLRARERMPTVGDRVTFIDRNDLHPTEGVLETWNDPDRMCVIRTDVCRRTVPMCIVRKK